MTGTSKSQESNCPDDIAYIDVDSMEYKEGSLISDVFQILALIIAGGISMMIDAVWSVVNFVENIFKRASKKK